MSRNFRRMLESCWSQGRNVCVGLDLDIRQILTRSNPSTAAKKTGVSPLTRRLSTPPQSTPAPTSRTRPSTKPKWPKGYPLSPEPCTTCATNNFEIPIILDAKRADIGNTNNGYVEAFFGSQGLDVDAVTVHPYLGGEALKPFLELPDKGVIVLVRTPNAAPASFKT